MAEKLTKKDLAELQAYQAAIREWKGREPERLSAEVWDEVWPSLQKGVIPEEYRDRIGSNPITERKHHFEGDRLVWGDFKISQHNVPLGIGGIGKCRHRIQCQIA